MKYLFDTSFLSALLSPRHPRHGAARSFEALLPAEAEQHVSAIAFAEMRFGLENARRVGIEISGLAHSLTEAEAHGLLNVTCETAKVYSRVKADLAITYLGKSNRKDRPKHLEDWIDKNTGKRLGVDENDLWMCCQAIEHNLIFVTADGRSQRIQSGCAGLCLHVI